MACGSPFFELYRLTSGSPPALHAGMVNSTAFPELGYVAAGTAPAKTSGASQGLGTLIALKSGRSTHWHFLQQRLSKTSDEEHNEQRTSFHLPGPPWRNRMEPHGSTYGAYRSAADRARRAECPRAWRTADRTEFWEGFTSPLKRAQRTSELTGFGAIAEVDRDSREWTTASMRDAPPPISMQSARSGNCSVTAALGVNRQISWPRGPTTC
jgi:hypothetical protein